MKAGTYDAKITHYTVDLSKNGQPQVIVDFDVAVSDEENKRIRWYGSLKAKAEGKTVGAVDITMAALKKMGFSEGKQLREVMKGPESGALDMSKTVPVSVELQADTNGKVWPRIQWVGSNLNQERSAGESDVLASLKALGLDDGSPLVSEDKNDVPF